jgi:pyruvate dehydrogenase E2 component (dihydrolipoamide acetyltransferase)
MIESQDPRKFASPRARKRAEQIAVLLDDVEGSGPSGRIIEEDISFHFNVNKSGYISGDLPPFVQGASANASPLAKRIAKIENIDLSLIEGTGWNKKVIGSDVILLVQNKYSESSDPNQKMEIRTPLRGMRKSIAERMVYSKQTAPHVTITVKAEATRLVSFRTQWIEKGRKFTFTDILVKIAGQSLCNNPKINVSLEDGEIVHHQDSNIGVAVALEDGLIVPVVHQVNQRPLTEIAADLKDKVNRAKRGKLKPQDLRNGRFTLSNLGMYEVDAFTPIINSPESAILGVGRIVEELIVQNGQFRIGKTIVLSLSFDHRVIDGAPAALFLKNIKDLLENPELLQIT